MYAEQKTKSEQISYSCMIRRCLIYDLKIIDERRMDERLITDVELN